MTTKTVMISRIGSELRRGTSINTQISAAIDTAIETYQSERFFKKDAQNEFTTVLNQTLYTSADAAWIARIVRIDFVHLVVAGVALPLTKQPWEWLDMADIANTSNQPFHWGYFAETFRMFPAPSTAGLTVRVGGNFAVSAPTTDGEMGNSWMVEGENLIRCHAKFELYTHVLANAEAAARLHPDNPLSPTAMALSALRRRSTAKALAGGSYVTPWGL